MGHKSCFGVRVVVSYDVVCSRIDGMYKNCAIYFIVQYSVKTERKHCFLPLLNALNTRRDSFFPSRVVK